MHYGIIKEAIVFDDRTPPDWRDRILRAATFCVPRANPDHEPLYPRVRFWVLELDDDGWPQRELGLDAAGRPLFGAPDDRNSGFWPDMASMQFGRSELDPIPEEAFEALWSAAQAGGAMQR